MENNTQIPEQNGNRQQINELETKNDKLLHKYVTFKMEKYSVEFWSHIAAFVAFVMACHHCHLGGNAGTEHFLLQHLPAHHQQPHSHHTYGDIAREPADIQ